jgi:hypothetical protein
MSGNWYENLSIFIIIYTWIFSGSRKNSDKISGTNQITLFIRNISPKIVLFSRKLENVRQIQTRHRPSDVIACKENSICMSQMKTITHRITVYIPPWSWMSVSCVSCVLSCSRADHLSRGIIPSVVCLTVIYKHKKWGGLVPIWAVTP